MYASTHDEATRELTAKEALRQLLRAVHTLRTYPANNVMSRRALDALLPALEAAWPLELTLTQHRVLAGESVLLEHDKERADLFARLYGDGIRTILFDQGLEAGEVERLVLALAIPLDADDLREDYVTRLWEAELPHVRIVSVDPYLDTEFADNVLEGKQRPNEQQEDVGYKPDPEVPMPPEEAFRVNEEHAAAIRREIEAARAAVPWESFLRAITETFALPPGKRRAKDCVGILEATFQRLIEPPEPQLGLARAVVGWMRKGSPAHARELLLDAVLRMSQPERFTPLHDALEEGRVEGKAVAALLADLGPPGAEVALALFGRAVAPDTRRTYAEAVVQVGRPAVPLLLETFGRGDAERDALVARVLGRIGAPEATAPLVKRLRAQTPVGLRREVVGALSAIGSADGMRALIQVALVDEDSACRVLALRGLSRSSVRIGHSRLLERIRSRAVRAAPEEEKDLIFAALGAVASDAAVPQLARMLQPKILGGAPSADRRRAAEALARLGSAAARSVLERGARSRLRRSHAALCTRLLRRFEEESG